VVDVDILFVIVVVVVTGVVVAVVVVAEVVTVITGVVKAVFEADAGDGVVNSSNASIFLKIFSSWGLSVVVVVITTDSESSGSLRKHLSIFSWV